MGAGATPANAADVAGGIAPSGTIAFAAGETSRTVSVVVAGDAIVEPELRHRGGAVSLDGPLPGSLVRRCDGLRAG